MAQTSLDFEREKFLSKQANKRRRLYTYTGIIVFLGLLAAGFFYLLFSDVHNPGEGDPTIFAMLSTIIGVFGGALTLAVERVLSVGMEEVKQDSDEPAPNGNNGVEPETVAPPPTPNPPAPTPAPQTRQPPSDTPSPTSVEPIRPLPRDAPEPVPDDSPPPRSPQASQPPQPVPEPSPPQNNPTADTPQNLQDMRRGGSMDDSWMKAGPADTKLYNT